MGGVRTAGDLVARMMLSKNMRIDPAKKYVADKLGVTIAELADTQVMREIREDKNLGFVLASANSITDYCKVENVIALGKAVEKYGWYPLHLE